MEGALKTKESEPCVLYSDGGCGLGPFRVANEGRVIPDGTGDSASLVPLDEKHAASLKHKSDTLF